MCIIWDINEANLTAKELNKDVIFETNLMNKMSDSHKIIHIEQTAMVRVNNHEHGV